MSRGFPKVFEPGQMFEEDQVMLFFQRFSKPDARVQNDLFRENPPGFRECHPLLEEAQNFSQ